MFRFLRLPIILPIPGGLRPDASGADALFALISNNNNYAIVISPVALSGAAVTLTPVQMLAGVTELTPAASGPFTITLPPTDRIIDQLGPTIPYNNTFAVPFSIQNDDTVFTGTLVAGDSRTTFAPTSPGSIKTVDPLTRRVFLLTVVNRNTLLITNIGTFATVSAIGAGTGTVTSVSQIVPPEFTITGSPVTTTGTLTIGKANENANTFWAGPTGGGPAQPTFRVLNLADLPGGVGTGSVTSVAMTVPTNEFVVTGSPITVSGTLAVTKQNQTANTVWAGPTSGGAAQPTFRPLVAADIPAGTVPNNFGTIAVSGQSDVVADAPSDTLTLVAGSNLTLTTNAGADSVTMSVTSGLGLSWLWGSGLDGNVHFDGTTTFSFATKVGNVYTLGRSVHATDCTIDVGVTVQSFDYNAPGVGGGQQIYCQGTFTCNGHFSGDGQRNTINLNIGGLGTPSGVNGIYNFGSNGGNSNGAAPGSAGANLSGGFGGNGGAGGGSTTPNAGGAGGVVTAPSAPEIYLVGILYLPAIMQLGRMPKQASPFWELFAGGAGGGGGGGLSAGVHTGGGGGGGGSPLGLFAKTIAGNGSITCDGAKGNDGNWDVAGPGAGGGGGGGLLLVCTTTANWQSLVTASANGGLAGSNSGGTAAVAGSAGRIVSVIVS